MKRDAVESRKQNLGFGFEEMRRKDAAPKKSKERGWFSVENITGHRITRIKNRD